MGENGEKAPLLMEMAACWWWWWWFGGGGPLVDVYISRHREARESQTANGLNIRKHSEQLALGELESFLLAWKWDRGGVCACVVCVRVHVHGGRERVG